MKKLLSSLLLLLFVISANLPAFSSTGDYLKIKRKSKHLHSRLSKDYVGFEYHIKNISDVPVKIEAVSLSDDVSGKAAYVSVKRTGLRATTETLAGGAALALPTLGISLIGAAVATPFIVLGSLWGNQGAHMEANRYDKPLETDIIQPKETVVVKTLANRLTRPAFKIVYINPVTNESEEQKD